MNTGVKEKVRKLCVDGINEETTEEMVKQYFSSFGEVVYCYTVGMTDLAFVIFKELAEATSVLSQGDSHLLNDTEVKVTRCFLRNIQVCKVFLKDLPNTVSEDEIIDLFEWYGKIIEVETRRDYKEGKENCKHFVSITFENVISAKLLCTDEYVMIDDILVRCIPFRFKKEKSHNASVAQTREASDNRSSIRRTQNQPVPSRSSRNLQGGDYHRSEQPTFHRSPSNGNSNDPRPQRYGGNLQSQPPSNRVHDSVVYTHSSRKFSHKQRSSSNVPNSSNAQQGASSTSGSSSTG